MTLQYMGTLPRTERDPSLLPTVEAVPCADDVLVKAPRHLDVHLPVRQAMCLGISMSIFAVSGRARQE